MKKDYYKKTKALVFCVVCFMLLIIHATWRFEAGISQSGLESKKEELKRTAQLNGNAIQKKYMNMVEGLMVLAEEVTKIQPEDMDTVHRYLAFMARLGYFDYVGISDAEGNAVDSQHQRTNISRREYFKEAMAGNAAISDVLSSNVIQGEQVQVMAVPIIKDQEVMGIVFGIFNIKTVDESLENVSGNYIYTQIIDSEGHPVTKLKSQTWISEYDNIWDYYDACEFVEGSVQQLRQDTKNLASGYYTLHYRDETQVTYYAPLGLKGYYIYSNIDINQLKEWLGHINGIAVYMTAEIAAAFVLLFLGIYWFNKKASDELWQTYKTAVSNEEILKLAVSESDKFIFEYDVQNRVLKKMAGENSVLFPEPVMEQIPDSILRTGAVDEACSQLFSDAFEEIGEKQSLSVTVKTRDKENVYWFKMTMKNLYDEKKRRINTVGIAEDVTDLKLQEKMVEEEKRERVELLEKAERDGLTGLYNASAGREKIDAFLASAGAGRGKHIFAVMDLDNFKQINDTFGHLYGDQVIIEMAGMLAQKFRHDDIAVRLGGDEFAVLLLNTTGFEYVEHLFRELVEECSKTYEKDGKKVAVSASIGIASAPEHGMTFKDLADKADQMLYEVKRNSKKGYRLYGNRS